MINPTFFILFLQHSCVWVRKLFSFTLRRLEVGLTEDVCCLEAKSRALFSVASASPITPRPSPRFLWSTHSAGLREKQQPGLNRTFNLTWFFFFFTPRRRSSSSEDRPKVTDDPGNASRLRPCLDYPAPPGDGNSSHWQAGGSAIGAPCWSLCTPLHTKAWQQAGEIDLVLTPEQWFTKQAIGTTLVVQLQTTQKNSPGYCLMYL